MKKIILSLLVIISSTHAMAFADITCKGKGLFKEINFSMEEMSDISKDSASLTVNGQEKKISKIAVTNTDYGLLSLQVTVGKAPGHTTLYFNNLGSEGCFNTYDAHQVGNAYVTISRSIGVVGTLNCTCEQD